MAEGLFGGRIVLGDEIGRGAMGVVYRAVLEEQPVAIKVLHPHLTSDLAVVGRFVREHQALSRIDHPNVVQVIDLIIDDPRLGIVMEHLDFPDLGKVLDQETIDPKRALQLAAGVAAGVGAIHDAQVAHRDLKPANVIVARDTITNESGTGQVVEIPKIADFGVSRLVGQSIVNATTTLGTPLYMSPEAAGGGAPVGRPADIYSLGVILFQLLTGQTPYTAEEPIAIAVAHVNNPVPIVGGIPDQLSELLQEMLAKNPEHRPDAKSVERILNSLVPHISPTLQPTILNSKVIDLTDSATAASAAAVASGAATVLIPSVGSASSADGFYRDQAVADSAVYDPPQNLQMPGQANGDHTSLMEAPILEPSIGHSWSGNGALPPPPSGASYVDAPPPPILEQTPPPPMGNQPPYVPAPPTEPAAPVGPDHLADAPTQPAHRRQISRTTSSSVSRDWRRWAILAGALLLLPLLWFGWTFTRGESDEVDLETTNAAFSFLPRVGSNGLITTRRWELTTNTDGQKVIKAEVIIANTSDDPVEATHYEAFPEVVDPEYLIESFRPTPSEIAEDPGVAIFEISDLQPRERFIIEYEMLAPDGVESVEELQALAEDQARIETEFVEALPSLAAQEALDTEGVLTELVLNPVALDLKVGELSKATVLGRLSDGSEVDPAALAAAVWTIEDPEIAEVTESNSVRGLKDGETTLTVSIGDIEASIDVIVHKVDDEVAGSTSTTARNTTTSSRTSTTVGSTTSTTEDTTASSTDTSTSSTSTSTSTTTPVEADLTMSPLGVDVTDDGSFKITFSTNLCTIANYSGAGQSYITAGWPDVGNQCWQSHNQPFTAVAPGTYTVTVLSRSAGGQQAQRVATVVIEDPDPGEDPLSMSALGVVVNVDGSFNITFSTNLCTIANYSGAFQNYVSPGWPNVGAQCWQSHGQSFTAVAPGTYSVTVLSRSAEGQQAQRSASVVIPEPAVDPDPEPEG